MDWLHDEIFRCYMWDYNTISSILSTYVITQCPVIKLMSPWGVAKILTVREIILPLDIRQKRVSKNVVLLTLIYQRCIHLPGPDPRPFFLKVLFMQIYSCFRLFCFLSLGLNESRIRPEFYS